MEIYYFEHKHADNLQSKQISSQQEVTEYKILGLYVQNINISECVSKAIPVTGRGGL
jgi:hypothetical protein